MYLYICSIVFNHNHSIVKHFIGSYSETVNPSKYLFNPSKVLF